MYTSSCSVYCTWYGVSVLVIKVFGSVYMYLDLILYTAVHFPIFSILLCGSFKCFSSSILFFVSLLVVIILTSETCIKKMYISKREVKCMPLVMHVQFVHMSSVCWMEIIRYRRFLIILWGKIITCYFFHFAAHKFLVFTIFGKRYIEAISHNVFINWSKQHVIILLKG